ncbi:hypothetical protein CAEBREN_02971 [Caenorhabditis brenneri]|uniref:CHK kinase-like domain-containing protein n=1 Tax=Caenorhabditis brenneri TaxID=135651 RepID=G0P4U1_CAEBE|nr:hypothetical protein CAEBREN_02971 [Caenorhabditis brenneri]
MNSRLEHLLRLLESSFPEIPDFNRKVSANFEKLDNAKSFWSDIYVAHLQKLNGIELDVPDTVFIKKENLFYKHFPHKTIPNFPFPKVYYTEDVLSGEGTGGIVAENLSDQIYEVEHVPGLKHEQVLRLMEAFAGFHSHLMKSKDKSYVMDFEEGANGKEQWGVEMQKRMFDEIHNFEPLDPDFFGEDRIRNIKWSFDYGNKNRAQQKAIAAFPGIICHGDMNVTNMLWKKGSPINELAAIIDFQMVFIGSIAFDIVRVLTLGLSREDRRSKTKEYLEHYYKTFCGFFEDGKVPMTFEQLSHQYKLIFPFATNFSLFGISIYIRMYKEGLIGTADDVTVNCEELLDRARGIVEDIEALENTSI